MYPWITRTGAALCLLTALATPAWAAGPATGRPAPVLISAPAPRQDQAPAAVTVNGTAVAFDQGPAVVDGVLMVPLRFIAEAAGGQVTWEAETRTVHVRMPDRTIMVQIGEAKAEMNQDGVAYFARNLIAMEKAPILLRGRTLISADALTSIFGFGMNPGPDGTLSLIMVTGVATSKADLGTIAKVATGDRPRILISGPAMANGEPSLIWAVITDQTRIIVQEAGQTHPGTAADLQVGRQVAVRFAGPLLMSYPAQGAAAEIEVQK
ncbi:MAG TPA: stalk domain-containing protein [Symbiobacteriaceae bacterium]|jgi:hypothetical protein